MEETFPKIEETVTQKSEEELSKDREQEKESKEIEELDEYIASALAAGTMKRCPFCSIPSELANGCNYVCCYCKQGLEQKSQWCFACNLAKYQPIQLDGPCCNDKSHNSH